MKKMVLGLIIGLLIGTAGTALAASETVQASFQKFMLRVDAQKPVEIEPLVYRGTTYLPVRQTANMLGYDVTYKADSKSIELKKAVKDTPPSKGDDEKMEQIVEKREKFEDIDRDVWLATNDPQYLKKYGLMHSASPEGGFWLIKNNETRLYISEKVYDRPSYGEYTRTFDGQEFRVKYHAGHMFIHIDDLRKVGLVD